MNPHFFSFEFFPPKTAAGLEKLRSTWRDLGRLHPGFFSCTYGAGGSTRSRTLETVLEIRDAGYCAAPHMCCLGSTRAELTAMLDNYVRGNIRVVVALRGDAPAQSTGETDLAHANDLVRFIREKTGDHFRIAVACYPECHPQAGTPQDDLRNLKRKFDAGADWAITQYFYNADAYFRFVEDCERIGIDAAIVPGVMPITDFVQLTRFSDACGAEIPRWLRLKLQSYAHDPASVRSYGLDVVTDLCDRLLSAGVPGLHFYTLNQPTLTSIIWRRLGLPSSRSSVPAAEAEIQA
jgi:methylenetetrahydrofolate reductase (NADPH)